MRLAEQLQPPTLTAAQLISGEERQERMDTVYAASFAAVMSGLDQAFWADVYQPIYDAVRLAVAQNMNGEDFKRTVLAAIKNEARQYAVAVSQDTD